MVKIKAVKAKMILEVVTSILNSNKVKGKAIIKLLNIKNDVKAGAEYVVEVFNAILKGKQEKEAKKEYTEKEKLKLIQESEEELVLLMKDINDIDVRVLEFVDVQDCDSREIQVLFDEGIIKLVEDLKE